MLDLRRVQAVGPRAKAGKNVDDLNQEEAPRWSHRTFLQQSEAYVLLGSDYFTEVANKARTPTPPTIIAAMHNRAAISLLLLQHGASGFQPAPGKNNRALINRHQPQTALRTAALDTIPSLESILDDGRGHVNGELAQAIYEWEAAHGGHTDASVKKEFSTRDGLRLVDELAREILASLGDERLSGKGADGDEGTRKSGLSYSDLVQEGMIALLRAMSTYTNYKSHASIGSASSFEKYATDAIRSSLLHFLAHSSRPIRLPLSLQTTLQAANVAAKKLRQSLGKEPSLVQVAKEVDIKPEQLALYRKLHRSMVSRTGTFVSVEDGMEVYDPTLAGVGVGNALHARRDSDSPGNMEGDDDESSPASMPASPSANSHSNEQDLIHLNSQEDDWERQPPERTVAPLRDALADTEEINNPLSNAHHQFLNEELDEFLRETLTEEELTIIQLRFGLVESQHGGRGWTANQIASRMGKEHAEIVKVASAALEKLRRAASTNWEEESDAFVEVSL